MAEPETLLEKRTRILLQRAEIEAMQEKVDQARADLREKCPHINSATITYGEEDGKYYQYWDCEDCNASGLKEVEVG